MDEQRSDQIQSMYEGYVETTKEPTAAALLVLAEQLADIDHQIALGVRKGLFGIGASDGQSILELNLRGGSN